MMQSPSDHVVQGHLVGKDVLVWSAQDAEWLSTQWRVVGGKIGALPQNPRQNVQLGLPCLLLPEEVALLCSKGVLTLPESEQGMEGMKQGMEGMEQGMEKVQKSSESQQLRTSVFSDIWERGYYLTSALKYGGDFLVYCEHPSLTHSTYIALVLPWKQPLSTLVSLARVAAKAKKKVLLCSENESQPCYYTLEWAGTMT